MRGVTGVNDSDEALAALARIEQWPVVSLGKWPTPIEEIQHPKLGTLLVKRDDLAGFGRGGTSGVKARKLEGFLSHLLRHGYREVIIPLANMTNLGHDLPPLLQRHGISTRLLIVDDPLLPMASRRELFQGTYCAVEFLGSNSLAVLPRLGFATLRARSAARRPLPVLPSPIHPSAVIGAARGFLEMVRQRRAAGQPLPTSLYIAAAAGTTVAGFVLAGSLLRAAGLARVRIVAVPVVPQRLEFWIPPLLAWTRRSLGLAGRLKLPLDFSIARFSRNTIYGRFDAELERTCEWVLNDFGLTIDPIYGAKSWSAMEASAPAVSGSPTDGLTMFWHCGYSPDWRAFRR